MSDFEKFSTENLNNRFCVSSSERYVLSLCLQYIDCYIEASSQVSEKTFLDPENRAIFVIMSSLSSLGAQTFDLVSVSDVAQEMGILGSVIKYDYLDALFQSNVSPENLTFHVNRILDSSQRRELCSVLYNDANSIYSESNNETLNASDIIAKAEEDILNISLESLKIEDAKPIVDGLREKLKEFEESPAMVRGLSTGLNILDSVIGGFLPGSLNVLAARPKMGKSSALMNWASHMVFQLKKPILIVDTEMGTEEHQLRLLSHLTKVPEKVIKSGTYVKDNIQFEALYQGVRLMEIAKEKDLYFHKYMPSFNIENVKSLVKKYKARYDIGAFIFDYIKIVEQDQNSTETQALGYLTGSLKDLAGVVGIPIITAVQLGRVAEGKSRVRGDMIADSDRVLRYCNTLMAICKKDSKEIQEDGFSCGTHRIQVLNTRAGGELYQGIDLMFKKPILTITEAEMQSASSILEQREALEENM